MNGSGTLVLPNANPYSGTTIVAAGTLIAQADGALGNGNVIVSNAANLTLQNGSTNGYLSPSACLVLGSLSPASALVSLNFGGEAMNVLGLSFDGGATWQPAGTYGSTASGAANPNDTIFSPNQSGMIQVVGTPTTTALASSGSPSAVYGSPLTLTATVTPSSATGTVTFYDGAIWLGTNGLVAGVATLSVNNLQVSASPHALTAVYGGDAADTPSTSAPVSQSTTVATVTPNIVVANKVYDGTTNASIASVSFAGILSSDTNYVHLGGTATAYFQDKNVGTGKPVNVTGLALSGSLSSNYTMPATAAAVTANITSAPLSVINLTANNRTYDGTATNIVLSGTAALSGVISNDVVNLVGPPLASFPAKTVGTNLTVTVTGYTISGTDAGNYTLSQPTGLTANITSAPLSVINLTANNRTYDGTATNIVLSGTAALSACLAWMLSTSAERQRQPLPTPPPPSTNRSPSPATPSAAGMPAITPSPSRP